MLNRVEAEALKVALKPVGADARNLEEKGRKAVVAFLEQDRTDKPESRERVAKGINQWERCCNESPLAFDGLKSLIKPAD